VVLWVISRLANWNLIANDIQFISFPMDGKLSVSSTTLKLTIVSFSNYQDLYTTMLLSSIIIICHENNQFYVLLLVLCFKLSSHFKFLFLMLCLINFHRILDYVILL
jgi:hypothetical protein